MTDNYIDSTGLVVQTLPEIVTQLTDGFKTIYGSNINVDSNSPDGQMINLFAQSKIDTLDAMVAVYNSFNPTIATGVSLDNICAINGVIRNGSTNTIIEVLMTATAIVPLVGQDAVSGSIYTIADPTGNQYQLINSINSGAGPNYLFFKALTAGKLQITNSTPLTPVTILLGITGVAMYSIVTAGQDEETDQALRYRRSLSVALPSQGYFAGLRAGLLALPGVTDAEVYENITSITDAHTIPPHSIWCVVEGGTSADIANVIYVKRNAGCGMYAKVTSPVTAVTVPITQLSGFVLNVLYNTPLYEALFVKATVHSIDTTVTINPTYLANQIAANFAYTLNQDADFTAITTFIKSVYPTAVVQSGGVCDTVGGTYNSYLAPTGINYKFTLSSTDIAITVV